MSTEALTGARVHTRMVLVWYMSKPKLVMRQSPPAPKLESTVAASRVWSSTKSMELPSTSSAKALSKLR